MFSNVRNKTNFQEYTTGLVLESHQEREVVCVCARYLKDILVILMKISHVGPSLLLPE